MPWNEQTYPLSGHYDELIGSEGIPRPVAQQLMEYLSRLDKNELRERRDAVDLAIKAMGISFTVYSDGENIDRAWPFDLIPRIIDQTEWIEIEAGLRQRLRALNMFIDDLYHQQNVLKDGIIPADTILKSKNFRHACMGASPRYGVWAHICGTDLVRDKDGTVYVLEDNLRVPSGVSYMLENRSVMKRIFPELFEHNDIMPVDAYPGQLLDTLASLVPDNADPEIVVLTPGIFNSAYFEHSYLAQQMGVELVEGSDLLVGRDDCVYMKTVNGLARVDVIYRRIDDDFIDPEVFREDSTLGVPGLMRAWKKGHVAIANAPGAGVADDKVVYAYVPRLIQYYLKEDAILQNVPTYLCHEPEDRAYVLDHLHDLVVKPANESGGYGMLIGPHSTVAERKKFAGLIKNNPRNYIAQPTLSLSTCPTMVKNRIEPRHIDLRPFVLQGESMNVTTGGLSRVALRKGSLVVNSSQGGGSKDTWVIRAKRRPGKEA